MMSRLPFYLASVALMAAAPAADALHRACLAADLSAKSAATAAELVQDSGLPGGICVVVPSSDAVLPLKIAEDERLVVQALFTDEGQVEQARQAMCHAGVYGRVSADLFDGCHLPYVDNLINLVVVDAPATAEGSDLKWAEIFRVLAPLGVAYVKIQDGQPAAGSHELDSLGVEMPREFRGWLKFVKPWPKQIDQWTHFLHGANGNPVAQDYQVGPPECYQWLGGPLWAQSHETDTNVRCLVTARGRIYYLVNEAPTSLAGPHSPPDKWFLVARDAFNGLLLWKDPVKPWGWRQWKPSWFTPRPGVIPLNLDKRVVAAGDKLYATLGFRAPVSEVDGRTGKVLRTFGGTANASEILYCEGSLILTVLQNDRAVVKRIDTDSGRLLWQSEQDYAGTTTDYYRFSAMRGRVPAAKVDPTLALATDGKVVVALDGDSVVGIDFADGHQRWRTKFPLVEADFTAGRIQAHNKVWNGALIVTGGVVLHASPNQLAAFSAPGGELLWQQPKKFLQHLWYEWQDVFVIDGLVWTWSAELAREKLRGSGGNSVWPVSINGYDLHSGRLVREVPLGKVFKTHHHHRCYRNKATVRYVIASRRGSEFIDLVEGKHSVNNWVRGACHMGMMPANGLQYVPPHPCKCYIDEKLTGFNALASGPSRAAGLASKAARGLERGPAFGESSDRHSAFARPSDWPTFRSDPMRSGFVHTVLPGDLQLRWQKAFGKRLGAPISVGDTLYVPLIDEHQVIAVCAHDGSLLWRFTAGARIDSPPTYHRGLLLFGSADGWVYCLRSTDGRLVWRLRGGTTERRIGAFGQLEAAAPVHGSVLVHKDIAYFVAGRSSQLDGGLRLCAVDPLSGRILRERQLSGPKYTVDNIDQNYELPMGLLCDILRVEGEALFLRSARFDFNFARQPGKPQLEVPGGLLDGAYFKRMPWSMGNSGHARVIVHDDTRAYGLRMFDSLQGLDPKVYFTPGRQGYLLFAADFRSGRQLWAERIAIRGRAMLVTETQLCVAGPPDVVDPADPLGAFEGRKGGLLRILEKGDGKTVCEQQLTSPPVFHGVAAANDRLFLALENGSVACFGKP